MTGLVTSARMRAIEASAIASGAVTGLELMERAGRGVVTAILERWRELGQTPGHAVVLCGPGNNGGDGFVVARDLAGRGWTVAVYLWGDPARLPPDARVCHDRWREIGPVKEFGVWRQDGNRPAGQQVVFVDALFGTGLTRALPPDLLRVLSDAAGCPSGKLVAVDIPSGYCADSGRALVAAEAADGAAFRRRIDLDVTFHRAKVGLHLSDAAQDCAALRVVDIGLDAAPRMSDAPAGEAVGLVGGAEAGLAGCAAAILAKGTGPHKYSYGHALVLSGGAGRGGAGRLAARGALRIGAGLVTLGAPGPALAENAARLDAIMLRRIDGAADLSKVLEDARITTLCLGPGLGLEDDRRAMVAAALQSGRKLVLDADALTLIAEDGGLFNLLHGDCVLTPHGGEFGRLFPDLAEALAAPALRGPAFSKVDATRKAATRAGCVVLFKGADTVVAGADGGCWINSAHHGRAAPWLATAGTGDVLAGFVTGLLARGVEAAQAARCAAWLHVECARSFGPGLIAEDLPEELPRVLRGLGV